MKCKKCGEWKAKDQYDTSKSKWCSRCRVAHKFDVEQYRETLKRTVLEAYSSGKPKCCKCGYNKSIKPLLIRAEGRKTLGITLRDRGAGFHAWLKSNKYPSGFIVICANCAKIQGMR